MPFACKYCIALKGISGEDIARLPKTEEELYEHIEFEHHIPVRREDETEEEAQERFRKAYPDAGTSECKCPTCTGNEEAINQVSQFLKSFHAHEGEDSG